MSEPTPSYESDNAAATSETPVADFLTRNPQAHLIDIFLFALSRLPLQNGINGDLDTVSNAAMIESLSKAIFAANS